MGRYWAGVSNVTTGTAKKTILQLAAASTQRNGLYEVTVSFRGINGGAQPVQVTLERQTTAGTGGAALATNWGPSKLDPGSAVAVSTLLAGPSAATWTAEPTAADVVGAWEVHPQAGITYQVPLSDEIIVDVSGRLAVVCTAAAAVGVTVGMRWREGA